MTKEIEEMTLEELLDYMPPCVGQEDKTYCLHFFKGTSGFIVEYSHVEENIHVDLDGIKFTRKTTLFDTFRMDKSLSKAIISFLTLLIDNKDKLRFFPRIHPLNNNK